MKLRKNQTIKAPHSYHLDITTVYSSVYVFSLVILNMISRINCLLSLVFLTFPDGTVFQGTLLKSKSLVFIAFSVCYRREIGRTFSQCIKGV